MIRADRIKVKEKLPMNPHTRSDTPEILFEDAHILVCVKPHGIATQSRQIGRPDMVNILKNHIHQNTPSQGEPYLAVVHRLDQPVRGILVFAKSPFAARELSRELQQQGFAKYYRALVEGRPPKATAVLEDYMVKDTRTNLSRVCSRGVPGAKLARLHYTVAADGQSFFSPEYTPSLSANGRTELDIRLETGRHHQIRVQLSHMGCPIVGDTKYDPNCSSLGSSWQNICLCAYRLEFCHPKTRELLRFRL